MEKRIGIALSPATNRIYIGTISKDGLEEWLDDIVDVTEDAVAIVGHHIRNRIESEGKAYTVKIEGKEYALILKEESQ